MSQDKLVQIGSGRRVVGFARAVLVGHSTGGGEVARYIGRHGTGRVAKAVLLGAVPPRMVKSDHNPPSSRRRRPSRSMRAGRTVWRRFGPTSSTPTSYPSSKGDARNHIQVAGTWKAGQSAAPRGHHDRRCEEERVDAGGDPAFRGELIGAMPMTHRRIRKVVKSRGTFIKHGRGAR